MKTKQKIRLIKGDITKVQCEAIVNAANSTLLGGGGVDGAIHSAGGPEILDECIEIVKINGGCAPGEAVITNAGLLPESKIIHTVGPIWNGGNYGEAEKLKSCYINSLTLAEEHGIQSIAFPNVSTGAYGFPKPQAANIAIDAVVHFPYDSINEVIFVCFDEENYQIYLETLNPAE